MCEAVAVMVCFMVGGGLVVIGRRGGFHVRTLPQPAKQVKTRLRSFREQCTRGYLAELWRVFYSRSFSE